MKSLYIKLWEENLNKNPKFTKFCFCNNFELYFRFLKILINFFSIKEQLMNILIHLESDQFRISRVGSRGSWQEEGGVLNSKNKNFNTMTFMDNLNPKPVFRKLGVA